MDCDLKQLDKIKIAGWQKLSLIDYPGKMAAVIFLAGCNMRCHYCHNRQILNAEQNKISFKAVWLDLSRRIKWLDAVVISGGEPTVYPELLQILSALRQLGLLIKLDTNGLRPDVVRRVVEMKLVDYIALDVKAPPEKYVLVTGVPINKMVETLRYLQTQKRVPYMLRTTLSPRLDENDLKEMALNLIKGTDFWQIQQCRIEGAYPLDKIKNLVGILKMYVPYIVVKGI